jgi:biotin-dependent carboxylase-like uncharacterized protein
MSTFLVMEPGAFTTVQDLGRFGYRHIGVPPSGALDGFACRVANLLVGNPEDSAVLEMTLTGVVLAVLGEVDVALTGADMAVTVNRNSADSWCTVRLVPGDLLSIGPARSGCRGYLAVTGGIDVPLVMGSRSTNTMAAMGGFRGRALKKGDFLASGAGRLLNLPRKLAPEWTPRCPEPVMLRAISGPQDDFFTEGLQRLFTRPFTVSARADRMGCRLEGPHIPFRRGMPESIISEPIVPGGIQIPADGHPIILLNEQTAGVYAKIATVISSDLPRVAQAAAGDTLRFRQTDPQAARHIYRKEMRRLAQLRKMLSGAG